MSKTPREKTKTLYSYKHWRLLDREEDRQRTTAAAADNNHLLWNSLDSSLYYINWRQIAPTSNKSPSEVEKIWGYVVQPNAQKRPIFSL